MDGKVKTRGTSSVPNTLGRQFGILPVGNPPVRPRRPKPSNSYALPVSGRTRGGPPSPHSSRNQILNSKEPLLQGASYSSGIEDDGIKFVDVPKDRKLIGQRRPLSGSARHRRPSSGTAQKDEHHGSASSQRDTPNDLDDDEVFHPYKTISQQEILEANHERDPEKIYEINLYASDLTKINNLQKFKKLRVLDLSCNYIPKIENLNENWDIRELKLYGNRIQQMENLASLRELSNLQLQHNKIKTIGKSLSQCTKIKTLNLSSNHIMKIDSSELSCCSHLTVLDLSSNLLDNLSVVNYLPNLEELNISGNRLRTVDFNRCKKLQDIDLSGNEVKDISGLKGMACLQILNVSNNRIVSFKSVGKLKSLTELHAAENHISEVSLMPNLFPQLEILNISRNYITSFEEVCTLNNLEELSELFISGNPFSNDDGVHISYMADIQSEFHNLDILDGALLKRSASRGAPLMRPMSVSTIITARQVESQMKQMESEIKSLEDDISKSFMYPQWFSISYSQWMQRQPEIIRIRGNVGNPDIKIPVELLFTGQHYLVSDDYIGLDVLSTQSDVIVSNFRKINIKGFPVYGMAQPARHGVTKVTNHLLSKKVGHTFLVLINLRNDCSIEIDGTTYSIRDSTLLEEPITHPLLDCQELEERGEDIKRAAKAHRSVEIYKELSNPPEVIDVNSILTPQELALQQKLHTLDMQYYRVPLHHDTTPSEQDFDDIASVICEHCLKNKPNNTAFLFFCRTGKSRTTLAMAISGLIMCHIQGFPKGANIDEQERVSCPNAQYTKGNFMIVQKLVRLLPKGQQIKREVDFILDEIFETMSPMHFHIREVIFVIYNKIKNAKSDEDKQNLKRQSIDALERYLYLIMFNAYLHHDKKIQWQRSFSEWMKKVAVKIGVYELLDNLGFYDFEKIPTSFKTMKERWSNRGQNLPFRGLFV